MESINVYTANLNEEDTYIYGMTPSQLSFIEVLCKKLNLQKEYNELIIPNGYQNAYSKFSRINASVFIDALKSGNSVTLVSNADYDKQINNKFGNALLTPTPIYKQSIKVEDNKSKHTAPKTKPVELVNPDIDILTQAQREIHNLLEIMRLRQGNILLK